MRIAAGEATYTVDTSTAHVARVVGPVISDREGRSDVRTPAELSANLHLTGFSLVEVQRLQGKAVVVFLLSDDGATV